MKRRLILVWLFVLLALTFSACNLLFPEEVQPEKPNPQPPTKITIEKDGSYTSKDEVALYIFTYKKLPNNFITKSAAEKLGWDSSKGNLNTVAPGKSIGGSRFGNYEGLLPDAKGRTWTECDIDYKGGSRNAKRIVFSNDGLIYYTSDHYQTFEKIVLEAP